MFRSVPWPVPLASPGRSLVALVLCVGLVCWWGLGLLSRDPPRDAHDPHDRDMITRAGRLLERIERLRDRPDCVGEVQRLRAELTRLNRERWEWVERSREEQRRLLRALDG